MAQIVTFASDKHLVQVLMWRPPCLRQRKPPHCLIRLLRTPPQQPARAACPVACQHLSNQSSRSSWARALLLVGLCVQGFAAVSLSPYVQRRAL